MALSKLRAMLPDRQKTTMPALELARTGPMSPLERNETLDSVDSPRETELARAAGEQDALITPMNNERSRVSTSKRIQLLGVSIPRTLCWLLLIPLLIIILSLFPSSWKSRSSDYPTLTNGTHAYYPTTLVISLDGFRSLYLSSHSDLVPNILSMGNATNGLRAESLQPQWPTLTFPNHWSMMTGLHVESHGIIANHFYDPEQGVQFRIDEAETAGHGQWWKGEPMWSVAEKAGMTTANLMWPGPPITTGGVSPKYHIGFTDMEPSAKSTQIFDWIDLPFADRPRLIFCYLPEVDEYGHKGGPDSANVEDALRQVDGFIGTVLQGLRDRSLGDIVNLIVVSDHGMAATSNDRLIFLDDLLGQDGFDAIEWHDGWPSAGLRFKEGTDTDQLLGKVRNAEQSAGGAFAVYTRDIMPKRWHFHDSERIAPIWVIPKLGWAITNHQKELDEKLHGQYSPKGLHGYEVADNAEAEMQAVFFAQGPFVSLLKASAEGSSKGWVSQDPHILDGFSNLELFSLVLRLAGLENLAPVHNGTVGFWDEYFV